ADLARFLVEAEAVAQLQHPHIVQIHEVGHHAGLPFFSLEYIEGGSLAQHLESKPQQPRAAAALVEKLARTIHYAHQHGIVHRDLKPANVLLQPLVSGEPGSPRPQHKEPAADANLRSPLLDFLPKIADFGLA